MAKTVNLYEAKTHLSKLVERAARGEEVIIAKAGQPKARLVPLDRMLVAQARTEGLTLVTRDPLIRSYPGLALLPA